MTLLPASGRVDNIRRSLVGLKMPRALEMLDATLRRIVNCRAKGTPFSGVIGVHEGPLISMV